MHRNLIAFVFALFALSAQAATIEFDGNLVGTCSVQDSHWGTLRLEIYTNLNPIPDQTTYIAKIKKSDVIASYLVYQHPSQTIVDLRNTGPQFFLKVEPNRTGTLYIGATHIDGTVSCSSMHF